MKPIVIIPAYNPDEKLIHLVKELQKMKFKVVVINDGSRKECAHIFITLVNDLKCEVCNHNVNMGKGAALKTGFQYATDKYPDCIGYVTADADGQHTPGDILRISNQLEMDADHIVLGSRNFNHANIPFRSRWGNRITSFVFLLSSGKWCADTQTGLRGIPKKFTQMCLAVPGNKYEYEMNMLMMVAKSGSSFTCVSIDTVYLDDNKSSHFDPVKDSIRIYYNIIKYSLSSLLSTTIDLTLFTILVKALFGSVPAGILAATVTARLVSGTVNYLVNKHWVFQNKSQDRKDAVKYFTLFGCQMFMSWLLVTCLHYLPIPITLVKMIVDTTLFFISYQIQKKYVFKMRKIRSVSY